MVDPRCLADGQARRLNRGHRNERAPDRDPPSITRSLAALGAMVDTLGARLGESTPSLQGALAQLRLAFVELSGKQPASGGNGNGRADPDAGTGKAAPA